AAILREYFPKLKVRVINIVDLMRLQPATEHPHGMSDEAFDILFTKDRPVVFAYHGYPWLIHRLTYRRTNHDNIHVRGYKEERTATPPFGMVVLNDMDRYHLVLDGIRRHGKLGEKGEEVSQIMAEKRREHTHYIREYGEDMPEIRDWKWPPHYSQK